MTNRTRTLLTRTGLIGLFALGLAACESVPTSNFPIRQAENPPAPMPAPIPAADPNPPAPVTAAPYTPPPTSSSGAIVARDLDPPARNPAAPPPAAFTPQPAAPAPQVAAAPPPPPPPPAVEMRPVAAGPIVDAEGPPRTYTVKSGDTMTSIARQFGMTARELAERNSIEDPSRIRPGQRLRGPATRGKAYVVQPGDTLSAIGRRFAVSATQIAEANEMEVSTTIRPGQRLLLPSGYRDQGVQRVAVATPPPPPPSSPVAPPAPRAPTVSTPPAPPPPPRTPAAPPAPSPAPATPPSAVAANPAPRSAAPAAPAIIPTAPPATSSQIQELGRGRFTWPVSGRTIGAFGSRGASQQSNGLNIAAASGTPVRASSPGEVIYAGSEIAGYGNLVLLRHDDGFVTVYAHLSRIDVRMRDQVREGQQLGQVGQTGGVTEPQLYFEMRHQQSPADMARPFDPMLVLPPQR